MISPLSSVANRPPVIRVMKMLFGLHDSARAETPIVCFVRRNWPLMGALVLLGVSYSQCQTFPGAWFVRKDISWVGKLSQPEYEITFQYNVEVPLRDGVVLSANIWRPKSEGRFPVIFIHTPYDKTMAHASIMIDVIDRAKYFVPRGYAVVAIDARGRYGSGGKPYLFWDTDWRQGKFEGQDVQDCLAWLAMQRWSSGKVGMTGGSYLAYLQWMGAQLGSPYLKAMIPYGSPDDHYNTVNTDGTLSLAHAVIDMLVGTSHTMDLNLRSDYFDWEKLYRHLPLRTLDEAMLGSKNPVWQDFMDHPNNDAYWHLGSIGEHDSVGQMGSGRYAQVKVPTLNITGWYDAVEQSTINNYLGMVQYGPESLRDKHRLIIGPWVHSLGSRKTGDLDFGPDAAQDFYLIEQRWFDYWLKGISNGIMDEPPVEIFVTGTNIWRGEPEWPVGRAKEVSYYLHGEAPANSRFGRGKLSPNPPASEGKDQFQYDPNDPVPTYGGGVLMYPDSGGPRDRRSIQRRDDVLVYTGDALTDDREVTGRILVKLYAASSAKDTDFTASLVDVHPDGYSELLNYGVIRARHRNSLKTEELIVPNEVYKYTIDLWSVSHVFLKGHRIQIEISSSNFPRYDRNLNTGHTINQDAEIQKATQTIYHDSQYPSCVILPVLNTN